MTNPNTPILIGAGLTVQKERNPAKAKSPVDLLAEAAQLAFGDTGNAASHKPWTRLLPSGSLRIRPKRAIFPVAFISIRRTQSLGFWG